MAKFHRAPLLLTTVLSAFCGNACAQLNHSQVIGVNACAECHSGAHEIWEKTEHATSWGSMHRSDEAQKVAKRLGIKGSIKRNPQCIECHYTAEEKNGKLKPLSGVSCESCHGAGEGWIDVHSDFGSGATAETESPQHKQQRLQMSSELGMRHRGELYNLAVQCYRCHTVPDEELINVGKHRNGGNFELLAWSQGKIRHNIFHTPGGGNRETTIEHQRVLYILGQLINLEYNLRGLAQASEAGSYSRTMIQRVKKTQSKLESITSTGAVPEVNGLLNKVSAVKLQHNQAAALEEAAEQVSAVAQAFAEKNDGSTLQAVDSLLPPKRAYKGTPAR